MSFTAKEVEAALYDFESGVNELAEEEKWNELPDWFEDGGRMWDSLSYAKGNSLNLPGLGEVTVEAAHAGDGDGSETYVVIRIGDQLFQKFGRYSSWDSNYWDGTLIEVESYVEPVTFYRRK